MLPLQLHLTPHSDPEAKSHSSTCRRTGRRCLHNLAMRLWIEGVNFAQPLICIRQTDVLSPMLCVRLMRGKVSV